MKIIAINASHRGQQGMTHFLINKLFRGAKDAGAECEEVVLARQKINRCLACSKCHTEDQYLQCVYTEKDDVAEIFGKISAADLVIYGTPVYVLGMSGLMKTFFDRIYSTGDVNEIKLSKSGLVFHHIDQSLCSKPFVSLVVCNNIDAEMPINARNYFRTYARFMDAPHVGELVRNGAKLFGYKGEQHFPGIEKVMAAYEQAGRELAETGKISGTTKRKANQEIIPVPFFGLLKRFKPFKRVMIKKAKEMLS